MAPQELGSAAQTEFTALPKCSDSPFSFSLNHNVWIIIYVVMRFNKKHQEFYLKLALES